MSSSSKKRPNTGKNSQPGLKRIAFVSFEGSYHASQLLRIVSQWIRPDRGYVIRSFETDPASPARIAGLVEWRPDAIVGFLSENDYEGVIGELAETTPIISGMRIVPSERRVVVIGDSFEFFELAHREFAQLSVQNIHQLSIGERVSTAVSTQEYQEHCKQTGREFNSFVLLEEENDFSGHAENASSETLPELANWLRQLKKPAGVFTQYSTVGPVVGQLCKLLGILVPEQVAIVGSDVFDVVHAGFPQVSSFAPPLNKIGEEVANYIELMINGGQAPKSIVRVKGGRILSRGSSGKVTSGSSCDIDLAVRFIHEHACQRAKVDDVVNQTQSVSRVAFHKQFRKRTGCTPAAMMQSIRMSEACRLLAETAVDAGFIAASCGYLDYQHFYRVFKKTQGISPVNYRKLAKSKQPQDSLEV